MGLVEQRRKAQAETREALRATVRDAKNNLIVSLGKYEDTGDHDHGNGPIAPGAPCPGGDCTVDRVRRAIAALDEV